MTKKISIWLILLISILVRYYFVRPIYTNGDIVRLNSHVRSEPIRYEKTQRITLYGLTIYLPLYPEITYGDKVVIVGKVADGTLQNTRLLKVEKSHNKLFKLRNTLLAKYHKLLPLPHSSLIAGVTIGAQSGIQQAFWNRLKSTGTAHVVVASGMNVTLVAGFLMSIMILAFPRRRAVLFTLGGIWVYSLLAGFDAPIIRAAIMGSVAFTAQEFGRIYDAQRALVLSALAMLVVNPLWISDLGFILSFVATASLMLFESKISSLIYFVPRIFREGLSTSLAAQFGVAPIIFITFGQFSILSPVINALVLWTIAPMTIIGMLGGLLSLFSEAVGKAVLLLSFPLTTWFIEVVQLFG